MCFLISESDRFSDGDAADTVRFETGHHFFLWGGMSEHGEHRSMPKPIEYWKLSTTTHVFLISPL